MRHLIERVLELSEDEIVPQLEPQPSGQGTDEELRALLESLQPRIRVYGVGGAGCNAVGRLESEGLFENSFVTGYAINTDAQALLMSPLEHKVLIGRTARGRGAGGDPTKGEAAALGIGNGTTWNHHGYATCNYCSGYGWRFWHRCCRTYCSPCKRTRSHDHSSRYLSLPVRRRPRRENAEWGLERLREHCDTILVIPNERLLEIEGVKDLPLASAFRVGDELLVRSIIGVTELLTRDGMVNLDFEDLKGCNPLWRWSSDDWIGCWIGPRSCRGSDFEALHSPLLDLDFSDARGALINVVGGNNLTLGEAERCAQIITDVNHPMQRLFGELLSMKNSMMKFVSCWFLLVLKASRFMVLQNEDN